jgi:putative transposase
MRAFLHNLSRFYVNNYDVICVENLNIKGIVRNHSLAQKILDASWGRFLQLLEFKAGRALVVKESPRGISEGLSCENPIRDRISACRILRGPPSELSRVPVSLIIEAGSPHPLRNR